MVTRVEVDCTTGAVSHIELTDAEIAEMEVQAAAAAVATAARQAEEERIAALKESAKAKLVSGQALSEEEAAVLVI
jgi:hypothetical protein